MLGYTYISLSLPIACNTKMWYKVYDKGIIVGKVQLSIEFYARPEKPKKRKEKNAKNYTLLLED